MKKIGLYVGEKCMIFLRFKQEFTTPILGNGMNVCLKVYKISMGI